MQVCVALAVMVPLCNTLMGGMWAIYSVLRGQRSALDVLRACGRATFSRTWWGVVPLDTWYVRKVAQRKLNL